MKEVANDIFNNLDKTQSIISAFKELAANKVSSSTDTF